MAEAYEFLGKQLNTEELLKGFDRAVFDRSQGTRFKWTEQLGTQSNGQMAFIRRELAKWLTIVNEKSGVVVVNYKIKGEYNECSRSMFKFWEINFEFVIKGAPKVSCFEPAVARSFSGFFKKFLAEELLRRFPLPFSTRDVSFAAGIVDMYVLAPVFRRFIQEELDQMQGIILGSAFQARLSEILDEKYKASLFRAKYMGQNTRFWYKTVFLVKWRNDVGKHEQYELQHEIDKLLQDFGARYFYAGFDNDYYRVEHES